MGRHFGGSIHGVSGIEPFQRPGIKISPVRLAENGGKWLGARMH